MTDRDQESDQECLCCQAQWIEFKLCEELRCTAEKACAQVLDYWQGELPSPCDGEDDSKKCSVCGKTQKNGTSKTTEEEPLPAVYVYNQQDGGPSDPQRYIFAGVTGDTGIACYDDIDDKYRIVVIRASDGPIKWGKAKNNSQDPKNSSSSGQVTGHACPYVEVHPCFDCKGEQGVDESVVDFVILPPRSGYDHDIKAGDVIAYTTAYDDSQTPEGPAPRRKWVIVSDYTAARQFKFEAASCLHPGNKNQAKGWLLYYDSSGSAQDSSDKWVRSNEVIVPQDPDYQNHAPARRAAACRETRERQLGQLGTRWQQGAAPPGQGGTGHRMPRSWNRADREAYEN